MDILNFIKKNYILILTTIVLLPIILFFIVSYLKKVFFINKCNNLLEKGEYEKVKKLFKKKNPSLLNKEILKIISKSYLNSGEKQKAIHYLQLFIDLGLINDEYELLNNNLLLAELLFELNQTTESFNKLIDVKNKGIYSASWNLLIGKIFISQRYFEKSILYFKRALAIDENSYKARFYYALNMFMLNPANGIKQVMLLKSFYKEPFIDFLEGIYHFSKDNYLKSILLFQSLLKKIQNDFFSLSKIYKEDLKYNNEFYKLYLTIFDLILLVITKFYMSSNFTGELSLLRMNIDKFLNISNKKLLKILVFEYFMYTLFIIKQNSFFQQYKKIYINQFNRKFNEKLLEFNSKKFFKKIKNGDIFFDIILFNNKKPLYVKPAIIKEDFKNFISYKEKTESFKNYIRKFNTLDKKNFIKISVKLSKLIGYSVKRYKYIYSKTYDSDGVNLKVYKTLPYFHLDLILIRRFKEYRLGKNYLFFLDDLRIKENAQNLILILNMEFDKDFYNYKEEFPNIKLIPKHKLGFLLEGVF